MRWLLLALLPSIALAQGPRIVSGSGTYATGPRILGEPAFAFELDALTQDEVSRPGWPVTTTRASTRMCFTGTAWQTVPENTPCIGRYGLASFGAGTNYVPNSTDFSGWTLIGGATRQQMSDATGDFWRITGTGLNHGIQLQPSGVAAGETVTATCEVRGSNLASVWASADASFTEFVPTSEWKRYSHTIISPTTAPRVRVYLREAGTIDVRQCQLEKSPTPGPRHDCGASACSWEGDVHAVNASTWPAGNFEIRLQYTPGSWPPAGDQVLLQTASVFLFVQSSGVAGLRVNGTTPAEAVTSVASSASALDYRVAYSGGTWTLCAGTTCSTAAGPAPNPHGATAYLGSNNSGLLQANGHIRLLRVSQ